MIQKTVTITEEQNKELEKLSNQEMQNYSSVLRDVLRVGLTIISNGVIESSAIKVLSTITHPISRAEIDEINSCLGIWRGLTVLLEHKLIQKGVDKEGNVYFKPYSEFNIASTIRDTLSGNSITWE